MNIDRARQVLLEVIELRKRFGRHVSTNDFNKDDLLDSLVVLNEHAEETVHAEVVKLKRQLGAAKSRETKAAKNRARLEEDLAKSNEQIDALKNVLVERGEQVGKLENELKALTNAS